MMRFGFALAACNTWLRNDPTVPDGCLEQAAGALLFLGGPSPLATGTVSGVQANPVRCAIQDALAVTTTTSALEMAETPQAKVVGRQRALTQGAFPIAHPSLNRPPFMSAPSTACRSCGPFAHGSR